MHRHNYWNLEQCVHYDVAMGQIPLSTERISSLSHQIFGYFSLVTTLYSLAKRNVHHGPKKLGHIQE